MGRDLGLGLLAGVAIFSLTLPFTRRAVARLDPGFVALGRALLLAVTVLVLGRWLVPRLAGFTRNRVAAAKLLKISRATLYEKLARYPELAAER